MELLGEGPPPAESGLETSGHCSVPNLTSRRRPPWLKIVCRSQNLFSQTLFGVCADLAYWMMHALQRPMHVAFMQAHLVDTKVPEGLGLAKTA